MAPRLMQEVGRTVERACCASSERVNRGHGRDERADKRWRVRPTPYPRGNRGPEEVRAARIGEESVRQVTIFLDAVLFQEIIKKQIEQHANYSLKTEYSKEKYKKRKEMKCAFPSFLPAHRGLTSC